MNHIVQHVNEADFNRHPARYIVQAHLLQATIYITTRSGSVVAVLRGYGADTALRMGAARAEVLER